jgi:two-component system response regulator FixJ
MNSNDRIPIVLASRFQTGAEKTEKAIESAGQNQVHVIDDDAGVRESLAFLLATDGLEVATYDCAKTFLQVAPTLTTGCIVADVRMPGMSGLDMVRHLRQIGVDLPVIVMTGHGDVPLAVEAMKEGARDLIEKPFDGEVMLYAIQAALASAAMVSGARIACKRMTLLSERERQVLDGLMEGLPNKTIAYDLGISPRTVEIYRSKLMAKMGASSFADLVRLAIAAA